MQISESNLEEEYQYLCEQLVSEQNPAQWIELKNKLDELHTKLLLQYIERQEFNKLLTFGESKRQLEENTLELIITQQQVYLIKSLECLESICNIGKSHHLRIEDLTLADQCIEQIRQSTVALRKLNFPNTNDVYEKALAYGEFITKLRTENESIIIVGQEQQGQAKQQEPNGFYSPATELQERKFEAIEGTGQNAEEAAPLQNLLDKDFQERSQLMDSTILKLKGFQINENSSQYIVVLNESDQKRLLELEIMSNEMLIGIQSNIEEATKKLEARESNLKIATYTLLSGLGVAVGLATGTLVSAAVGGVVGAGIAKVARQLGILESLEYPKDKK